MSTEHGDSEPPRLPVGVIAGSIRPGRQALRIAEWVCADTHPALDLRLVDLVEVGLPLLCEPAPAAWGQYEQPATKAWSAVVAGFDAFILVTPEYNHSTSPALKNALDHLYWEWRDKPVAFVGYGLEGGTRAVEHLRAIAAELGLAGVGPQVAISLSDDFTDGKLEPRAFQAQRRERILDHLANWATALRAMRMRTTAQGPDAPRDPSP